MMHILTQSGVHFLMYLLNCKLFGQEFQSPNRYSHGQYFQEIFILISKSAL